MPCLPCPLQGLEDELAVVQGELRSCCAQLAEAQQAADEAAAEGLQELQRRRMVEQQLLAVQQEVERCVGGRVDGLGGRMA